MILKVNEPMGRHTTFGTGGPATLFVVPESVTEMVSAIGAFRRLDVPLSVVGHGSNLLVPDDGYAGAVISTGRLSRVTVTGDVIGCEAGASLPAVSERACKEGLSGLEFACGIPGSVGGACAMNAGAYGRCVADVIESVTVMDADGQVTEMPVADLGMGYRTSRILDEGLVVLTARLRLAPGATEDIRNRMTNHARHRRETQPVGVRSAGSTFKRPDGDFAGRLIDEAGLKGLSVGGASVSDAHAGFVVSDGTATTGDVLAVIGRVTDEVGRRFGVRLEPEVRLLH